MYITNDLLVSRAIQAEMLGTVRTPASAMLVAGSRPVPRPIRNPAGCLGHDTAEVA